MKAVDLFSLSTRMFRTRPSRTWLTILGISVGIGAVLFLVSLGYGLQRIILQKIIFNQAMLSLAITSGGDVIKLNKQKIEEILKIPQVEQVAPQASYTGQVTLGELNGTLELRAVDASFFSYAGITPKAGGLFAEGEKGQAVISDAVMKIFGAKKPEDIIGQEVKLKLFLLKEETVSALASPPKGASSGVAEVTTGILEMVDLPSVKIKGIVDNGQEGYIYLSLPQFSEFVAVDHYQQARVKVASSKDLALVKDAVLNMGFQVQSLSETIDQANKIFGIIQIILGLFGAVALVVSSIGMFNTMTVTLLERTNEIGIMRALGASKATLRNLFLSEAVIIGFLGGLVGVLIGIAEGELFNFGVNMLAARFGGAKTDLFVYPGWFLFIIVVISLFIGFLSGIFPARRAASMDPLEALRYK